MFPKNQIIHCKSYIPICDQNWGIGDKITGKIIHVDLDSIPEFFEAVKSLPGKYIVVSSCSDWWVTMQAAEPAWLDIKKAAGLFARPEHTYESITIPPRINRKRCIPYHRYAIKCYSYTSCTFDAIPDNIHAWFTTNKVLHNDRMYGIPFGVNNVNLDYTSVNTLANLSVNPIEKRIKKIYCNWQFYTNERVQLFEECQDFSSFTCETNVPYNDFVDRLNTNIGCLCPFGNGVDCFRTLECLYCGTIPIITCPFGYGYECYRYLTSGLEPHRFNNLPQFIDSLISKHSYYNYSKPEKHERLYFDYWKDLIINKAKQI